MSEQKPSVGRTADVGRWAREIVAKRALIVGIATLLLGAAVSYGWLDDAQQAGIAKGVDLALTVLGLVVAAFWARSGVTPADPALAPKAADGRPLVPEGSTLARPPMDRPKASGNVRRTGDIRIEVTGPDGVTVTCTFAPNMLVGNAARAAALQLGRGADPGATFANQQNTVYNRDQTLAGAGIHDGDLVQLVLVGGAV